MLKIQHIARYFFSGGYDLQDPEAAAEMTDRVLTMLSQYLVSNQALEMNNSFQIYMKVLSVGHMRQIKKKKRFGFGRLHVGQTNKETFHYWSLSPPSSNFSAKFKNMFENKCLLICFIFGLLQNAFYFSNRTDKRFLRIKNIHSKVVNIRNSAASLLFNELETLLKVTKLQTCGPYHLQSTVEILHEVYKCQIFIFDNIANTNKLCFMYPVKYNDKLQPIYMFRCSENEQHLVYIRYLNAYFRKNYYICFECKRKFRQPHNTHLCTKRETCFSCRRFTMSNSSYIHEKLIDNFCNKHTSNEPFLICNICNCTLFSQHCAKGHKLLCNGKGRFGFKCLKTCQRFFYCNQGLTSEDLKRTHVCVNSKLCSDCHKPSEPDHLCRLAQVKLPPFHNRLCFFKIIFLPNDVNSFNDVSIPLMAIFMREEKERGFFKNYVFFNPIYYDKSHYSQTNQFKFSYFPSHTNYSAFDDLLKRRPKKISEDFQRNSRLLGSKNGFGEILLKFLLEYPATSYICNDPNSFTMVSA